MLQRPLSSTTTVARNRRLVTTVAEAVLGTNHRTGIASSSFGSIRGFSAASASSSSSSSSTTKNGVNPESTAGGAGYGNVHDQMISSPDLQFKFISYPRTATIIGYVTQRFTVSDVLYLFSMTLVW
jgi:hypothetical protein